ncbi:hypothetical protein RRG08_045863 [Elysia crispata]|uniref:Uncharacterized protein n=1 Tax=Elysia crispata TaxID=231223 RepID=A0AAE1DET0_9GAST|nr:hypothetical protein RRG08_045863 [Elysia crispata]
MVSRSILRRHRIPHDLLANNMPFNSFRNQMQQLSKECLSNITTNSPRYAQFNGQNEPYLQTVNALLWKAVEENRDANSALLSYGNTPLGVLGTSPA